MEQLTEQIIFDRTCEHMKSQKVQAITPNGRCRYRTEDGLKCNVGHLIPDEDYDPKMDANSTGGAISTVLCRFPQLHYLRPFQHLLSDLQAVHDSLLVRRENLLNGYTAGRMLHISKKYKLDASKVDWA